MSFGETVKRLRKEKGFTQDQLANLLNVTPQAISRWENNSAMPDISQLVPIANVFKVSTDTLLEVNVEETEKQIKDAIDKTLGIDGSHDHNFLDETRVEELRDAIRRFPQDVRLKRLLVGILEGKLLQQEPYPDLALIREITELLEDCIEYSADPESIAKNKAELPAFYARLNQRERIKELANEAPEMDNCREVIIQNGLTGKEQIEARKDLIFKCTDRIIQTVHKLFEENAEELTDQEWIELKRAQWVVGTVYGGRFSDLFMLQDQMYSRVHGALIRNDQDDALDALEDIVRRLKLMEAGEDIPETSLILNSQYESLYLMRAVAYSESYEANYVLERLKKDLDGKNERFQRIISELEKLSESEGSKFSQYCRDKYIEHVLAEK